MLTTGKGVAEADAGLLGQRAENSMGLEEAELRRVGAGRL